MPVTKRVLLGALVAILLSACGPLNTRRWINWHNNAPRAAVAWLDWKEDHPRSAVRWLRRNIEPLPRPARPPSTPSTSSGPSGYSCPQWYDEAIAAGFTDSQWRSWVARVMYAESRCNPNAYNPNSNGSYGHARGLMQIMDGLWPGDGPCPSASGLEDPYLNLVCAKHIYNVQGPHAWVTY